MKDLNDILNSDFMDSGISDELLAAYIDGNTSESENALIENTLNGDSMLAEAIDIVNDSTSFGNGFDWDIHKGDYGFWELGLPPVIDALDMATQNQDYGLDFANDSNPFDPSNYRPSGEVNGNNDDIKFGDITIMSSDLDDTNW